MFREFVPLPQCLLSNRPEVARPKSGQMRRGRVELTFPWAVRRAAHQTVKRATGLFGTMLKYLQ